MAGWAQDCVWVWTSGRWGQPRTLHTAVSFRGLTRLTGTNTTSPSVPGLVYPQEPVGRSTDIPNWLLQVHPQGSRCWDGKAERESLLGEHLWKKREQDWVEGTVRQDKLQQLCPVRGSRPNCPLEDPSPDKYKVLLPPPCWLPEKSVTCIWKPSWTQKMLIAGLCHPGTLFAAEQWVLPWRGMSPCHTQS